MGVRFRVVSSGYGEGPVAGGPARVVRTHALAKARDVAARVREGLVLGADTVVHHRGRVLGKPRDRRHAERMLGSLQGDWHTVYTGVALLDVRAGRVVSRRVWAERTRVRLRALDRAAIRRYFRRIDPLDKAGSYAIQSRRVSIVEEVRGSLSNAVGLPVETLARRIGPAARRSTAWRPGDTMKSLKERKNDVR